MDPALEALPARPLTAQDVATLNDAPALGIIPYSWYGEQVIALLLLYDERRAGEDQQTADAVEQQAADGHLDAGSEQQQADEAEPEQDGGGENRQDEKAENQQANENDEGQTEDNETDPPEREKPDRTATARDETSSFGSDDSPGVGTVEVIDSGDLTPDEDDDSLAPDLGGESDRTEQVDLTEDEMVEEEMTEDEMVEEKMAEDDEQSEGAQEGNQVPEQDNLDQTETAQEEGEALHVYAVGFDGGVDSWVAIAEIDPDAELTDAEPLFREWATRTYHDQIVDRLAIGPSEYDIDE